MRVALILRRFTIRLLALLFLTKAGFAVELKSETIGAFDRFIRDVEVRLDAAFTGRQFLWSDDSPGVRQQLVSGTVVAQPLRGNGTVPLKGGLVQDWRGAVFIPGASLRDVLSVVQDYDHHRVIYKPDIEDARVESHTESPQCEDFLVYMRIVKSKFMLADVLSTEHNIRFTHLDAKRVYSRAYSKRINEVASAGQAGEHELPSGADRGLLWRLYGYWFFEERDNGVYIACESITLTRDIPFGMGAVLGPVIHDLPGESIRKSLEQTRRAVVSKHP